MQKEPIETASIIDKRQDDAIFESEEQFQKQIAKLCHGDLCVIGRLWIQALRTVLVGAKLSIFPVVAAAKKEAPKRPPKMKYKDLPVYECPHNEYKNYLEDQRKCPKANVKILQTYLFPKVHSYRKNWSASIKEFMKDANELKSDACAVVCKKKDNFITFMRCRDNLMIRQAVVATGAAYGFYIGRGNSYLKKLFFTSLGALAAGALCFPKETDEIFREVSFKAGKYTLSIFNGFCGMNLALREKIPCRDEMPPPPPYRPAAQKNKCEDPKPKKKNTSSMNCVIL